jgi:Fe-S oxidoreductase
MVALKYNPGAVELMDKTVLDCAAENISQRKNRFFLKDNPGAILIIEFARETKEDIHESEDGMIAEMKEKQLGFHYPKIFDSDIQRVWSLRKAGLGALANIPGDAKSVSVIEDTSVPVEKLEEYIQDFQEITKKHDFDTVYHAHISVGELHIRPVLNLKDPADVRRFRAIALDTAHLVKRYRGSLSGEHGDGRVRAEFIPIVIGEENYDLMKLVKKTWDPENILNPGKIVDPEPMDTHLRFKADQDTGKVKTVFNYDAVGGIHRLAEKCNGSGDCRKSALMGGTMCPSYMATKDEGTTTRARANILREFFNGNGHQQITDREVYQVLDLCLSCKGCKSECPSNVDMAKMKAEFLQNFYDRHGIPLRARMVAYISKIQSLGALVPCFFNFLIRNRLLSGLFKSVVGFARERSIPGLHKKTLRKWCRKNLGSLNDSINDTRGTVYIFIDEFTNYTDTPVGITAIKLLTRLKYKVSVVDHSLSGRTFFSKGLLRTARKHAIRNVEVFKDLVNQDMPLVGLEPSAILAFRDEYPELVNPELRQDAQELSQYALTIEEFLMQQMEKGVIKKEEFTSESRHILFHGHCQQKAVAATTPTNYVLSFPEHYSAEEIPSGCCGMAGSFGFEKEHYDLSMKVGELVLFPAVRMASEDSLIVAPGTSCRQQIADGTGREAYHPAEVLYDALID